MSLDTSEQHLVTTLQASRYLIAAVVLAVLWAVESLVPMFAARTHRLSHGLANLGLALINGIIAIGFAFAILQVTEYSRVNRIGLLHFIEMPVWVHWTAALLVFDCWQYWWHRINHRVAFFWRFHAVHHADAEMDVTSAVRFHTVEIILSFLARMLVLPLIGMTIPQVLLYELLSLPVILLHHSNINMPQQVDRCLRWLIVTPWMHVVHHSRLQPETDSNYSSLLSCWDRLFRSLRLRDDPHDISLGLDGWDKTQWRSLGGMLKTPFVAKDKRGRKPGRAHRPDR